MAKKNNNKTLGPSKNPEWDIWGNACGFTSWDAAAEAIGLTTNGLWCARQKTEISTRTRLTMAAVLADVEPFTAPAPL